MEYMSVDSEGSARGLLCIWDPEIFKLNGYCSNRRFILFSGTFLNSFDYVLLNVYAPNDASIRNILWEILVKLKSIFPNPWCMGGDFNEIRNNGERIGFSRRDKGMKEFNEFINKCELTDLPMLGRKYTWCNAQENEKWSRIDRIMLSPEWLISFKLKLWGLPRLLSDHCPLLIRKDERDWGPKPFKFINAWTLHPNFPSFVENTWKETTVRGGPGQALLQKLKLLKLALKKWNSEVFGNISTNLKAAEVESHDLDISVEERPLLASERDRRRVLQNEIWKLSKMMKWMWQQKSRVNWTLNGDKNTRFFHVMASCKQNRNIINIISVNGVIHKEPDTIKQEALLHFKKQFTEDWANRPSLGGVFKLVQVNHHFQELEIEFSEAEIKAAIKECNGNKAPGPDGFNLL
ncbi:uncharacterized protein LOC114277023 [Camellia sinensis]|uniref:uncharacterized protein LOC114277023 n=1 Tax=Camellia sinensis TaxID=4442 RepID=UPI0010357A10|nr:uncharacterized protein LOC114277023 [Camellia sinensis]